MYYVNADVYLIDKSVADITPFMAVVASIGLILAAWLFYDLLCRSGLNDTRIGLLGSLLLVAAVYLITHLFSGRGAYIQIGAMLGTIMVANVLMVIIPGQRELVEAKTRGEEPDPLPGVKARQRSVHNNYLTLPVLFIMLSPHYPMTYGHEYNWLALIAITAVGVLVRHFFNLRNQGRPAPALLVVAVILIILTALAIAPKSRAVSEPPVAQQSDQTAEVIPFAQVRQVIVQRCNNCHSAEPNHPTAPVAPNGVMFDTPDQISQWAQRIHERTVTTHTMPLANLTQMTLEERELVDQWYRAGAALE